MTTNASRRTKTGRIAVEAIRPVFVYLFACFPLICLKGFLGRSSSEAEVTRPGQKPVLVGSVRTEQTSERNSLAR